MTKENVCTLLSLQHVVDTDEASGVAYDELYIEQMCQGVIQTYLERKWQSSVQLYLEQRWQDIVQF
jgi:hypothetical protein